MPTTLGQGHGAVAGEPRADDRRARRAADSNLWQGRPQLCHGRPRGGAGTRRRSSHTAERELAEHWREQLGPVAINADSDFFASVAPRSPRPSWSRLCACSFRRSRWRTSMTIADSPSFPSGSSASSASRQPQRTPALPRTDAPLGPMQLAGLLVLFAVQSVPWLIGSLIYGDIGTSAHRVSAGAGSAWHGSRSPVRPRTSRCSASATRVLLRDLKPGRYPRYSSLAARLWFVDRLAEVTHFDRLGGMPGADRYARLVGADVDTGARLSSVPPAAARSTSVPDATVEAQRRYARLVDRRPGIRRRRDHIGTGARIATRTLLNPGAIIGEGAEVEPGAVVSGEMPADERWGGSPARRLGVAGEDWPAQAPAASGALELGLAVQREYRA